MDCRRRTRRRVLRVQNSYRIRDNTLAGSNGAVCDINRGDLLRIHCGPILDSHVYSTRPVNRPNRPNVLLRVMQSLKPNHKIYLQTAV